MEAVRSADRTSCSLSAPRLRCCHNSVRAGCAHQQKQLLLTSAAGAKGGACPVPSTTAPQGCPENSSEGDCSLERRAVLRGACEGGRDGAPAQWPQPGSPCDSADPSWGSRRAGCAGGAGGSLARGRQPRGQVPAAPSSPPSADGALPQLPTAAPSGLGADAQTLGGDVRRVRFGSHTACTRLLGFHARSPPWQSRSGLRENLTHVLGGLGSHGVDRNFK